MHMHLTISAVTLATLLAAGCQTELTGTAYTAAVWADDGSEIAVALRHVKATMHAYDTVAHTDNWAIELRQPDLSGAHELPVTRPGKVDRLYDMHKAGYVLVHELIYGDGTLTFGPEKCRFVRVATSGAAGTQAVATEVPASETDPTVDTCNWPTVYDVLPSRDGTTLARVLLKAKTAQVDFLDAKDFALKGKHTLTLAVAPEGSSTSGPKWRWRTDGTLVFNDATRSVALTPGKEDEQDLPVSTCVGTPTSSIDRTASGKRVAVTANNDGVQFVESASPDTCE